MTEQEWERYLEVRLEHFRDLIMRHVDAQVRLRQALEARVADLEEKVKRLGITDPP